MSQHTAATSVLERSLARSGLSILARVEELLDTADLAFFSPNGCLCILRVVRSATNTDYRALATILAGGDFDRAILVYSDRENSILSDEIETWHIDDIEHLVARLAAEVAA